MAPVSSTAPRADTPALRAPGLLTARISSERNPLATWTLVAELDAATIERVRAQALAMRACQPPPILIELRYVADPVAAELIARLEQLASGDVRVAATALAERAPAPAAVAAPAQANGAARPVEGPTLQVEEPRTRADTPATAAAEPAALAPAPSVVTPAALVAPPAATPDPFGLDPEYRARWLPPLRFLFERYWRVEVSGLEHVPSRGAALIAANHSGAVPADAFMLAVALELRHPARRPLRVLYDKFVDALPFIGPIYTRLGGISASFANAELLLRRGELVGLFPEGIAGVEKRCTERYRLQPFKSGTARLSVRTGSPIVPVAIVGAEEAYPVVACLYRTGQLVGLPWIPVTPIFPICGVAGALPFPTKWHIRFCEPIVPPVGARSEEEAVAELTRQLRVAIVAALAGLLARRRSLFL